jgi:hypothetical protein
MPGLIARHLTRLWMRPVSALAAAAMLGSLLAGCSSTGDSGVMFFADPGKYQFHNCDQLVSMYKAYVAREQELRELIAKAERSSGGAVVGAVAYRSDYVLASENVRLIDQTARAKGCAPVNPPWRSNTVIQ